MSATVQEFEDSLALPFSGIGMKTGLFQSCGHCWVFQICWCIECSTFTASYFRIWNSSAGIPSPPLALFVVMLPKTHWTSHSRMSGSRWVITPSWVSGSLRSSQYCSFVYSWHLFLISCPSVRSIPFLSFIVPINCGLFDFTLDCVTGIRILDVPRVSYCYSQHLKWAYQTHLRAFVPRVMGEQIRGWSFYLVNFSGFRLKKVERALGLAGLWWALVLGS